MAGDPTVANAERDGLYGKGRTSKVTTVEVLEVTDSYTLKTSDSATLIRVNSANANTITLPAHMEEGYQVSILQFGAGASTFVAGTNATVVNRSGFTKTAGQYSIVTLIVMKNDDNRSAKWMLVGDAA